MIYYCDNLLDIQLFAPWINIRLSSTNGKQKIVLGNKQRQAKNICAVLQTLILRFMLCNV